MTRKDVRKVVDALQKNQLAVLDTEIPTYKSVCKPSGIWDLSLNLLNIHKVVDVICEELGID